MTKFYVSDLWSDTSGHFFMYGTGYAYYNYPTIYLDQPATGYKQSKEVNTTYPNHLYGFKICRATMTGNIITIEGYFGAYHGYDNTRANFAFAIVPSSYVDVDSVPPNFLIIEWVLSTYGWSNGSYGLYAKVQFRINSDNTITVLSATPGNPTFYYASPYGLIGQDVTVLFGYCDSWTANWSQWACARNDSYIDLPSLVTQTLTESLGLKDSTVKASSIVRRELLGLSDVYARVWSIHRVYSELLGLKDTVAKSVSVSRAETLGLVDFYARCWTAYRVFAEPLGLLDTVSAVRLFYQTLTELLELSDVVAKAPSVVRAESLGLLDYYSRIWSVYRTYGETLGLADKVQKASSTLKSELLGLSDVVQKSPSILKSELLGLLDVYSRTWTAYRTYTEPLGLMDTVGKETSRTFAEVLGLSDVFARTWTIQRVLGESLGLRDALQKTPSTLKTEMLGLLDSYSRVWTAFRAYTESLGLSDKVSKAAAVPLAEALGLFDTMIKSPFITKAERLGFADFTVKGVSVAKIERLGLSDVLKKTPGKTFTEPLGLEDVYSRVLTVHRTFTEPLGLKDTVSRGVALHALVEVLGLYDSILYGRNVTILAKLIRKYMQLVKLGGDWNE